MRTSNYRVLQIPVVCRKAACIIDPQYRTLVITVDGDGSLRPPVLSGKDSRFHFPHSSIPAPGKLDVHPQIRSNDEDFRKQEVLRGKSGWEMKVCGMGMAVELRHTIKINIYNLTPDSINSGILFIFLAQSLYIARLI